MKTDFGRIASYVAGTLALLSLVAAFLIQYRWPEVKTRPSEWQTFACVLIGVWVLGPPVWFWTEWVFLSQDQDPERLKHTHDLARNIWIALVVVLAAILNVKWPKG